MATVNKPDFTMYIRGHLYAVEGFIERGDASVGLYGEYYIADSLYHIENAELASQAFLDSLNDSEQECISAAAMVYHYGPPVREYYWREHEEDAWYGEMLAREALDKAHKEE